MTRQVITVTQRHDGWRFYADGIERTCAPDVAPEQLATTLTNFVASIGLKSPTCVLSPASTACFFVKLRPSDDVDLRDRAALAFELEDHLPIDAESFVADFVETGPSEISAIAIEHARWKPLTDAIESVGVSVRSIVPAAVLATRGFVCEAKTPDDGRLFWFDGNDVDVVDVTDGRIVDWKHLRGSSDVIQRDRQFRGDAAMTWVGGEPPNETMPTAIEAAIGPHQRLPRPMMEYEAIGANAYAADQGGPWFDLRRDALAALDPFRAVHKNLRALALASVACFLTLVAAGYYRSVRIENRIAQLRDQQVDLFEKSFPDTKAPGAILRRVRSEHARLVGARGGQASVGAPVNAPEILRRVLGSLPVDVRFRIEALAITDGSVDLDLQVRSPVDAGAVAAALSAAGFATDPPVTLQKDAKTFTSTIRAEWSDASPSAKEST